MKKLMGSYHEGSTQKNSSFVYAREKVSDMTVHEYGIPDSSTVLIQPVDEHDLSVLEYEIRTIEELSGRDFRLLALKVDSWNNDLSPWQADPVFGKDGFGDGAADTLSTILALTADRGKRYFLGGYSLAGPVGGFPDRCVLGCGCSVTIRLVSGIFGLYEVTRNPNRERVLEPW